VATAERVQSGWPYDANTQDADTAHIPDADLCLWSTTGKIKILVLCVYAAQGQEDTRRNFVLQSGSLTHW